VRQAYTAEQQVLMLCSKVEHAINLWQHLPEFSLCHAEQDSETIEHYKRNGYLPQGYEPVDAKKREAMRAAFEAGTLKKVIATDVWATGVDFPSLQVLYRVDARQSEIIDGQAPARVSRIDGDTKGFGEVVDCCDVFDPYFYKNSLARRRHYNVHGWTQVNWPTRRGTRSPI
jgi:superfamily II DNA or RNA helicase